MTAAGNATRRTAVVLFLLPLLIGARAGAQDMPDPSQIHGRAIPAAELPDGTVTVRVVREAIGNNIGGQPVTVLVQGRTHTATTDDLGRAEFRDLPRGSEARAETTVEGEALVSEPFPVPSAGGLRVILIANIAGAAERRQQEEATALAAPPVQGLVVLGGDSRIVTEFQSDTLRVFYRLDIINSARTRVDIGRPTNRIPGNYPAMPYVYWTTQGGHTYIGRSNEVELAHEQGPVATIPTYAYILWSRTDDPYAGSSAAATPTIRLAGDTDAVVGDRTSVCTTAGRDSTWWASPIPPERGQTPTEIRCAAENPAW